MTKKIRDFDSIAARWDLEPRRVQLARAVADMIVREASPKPDMKGLDFGCGTGLVTLVLSTQLQEIVAADSSKGMLDQLSVKLAEADISNVQPLLLDLECAQPIPGPFDLIVSSMTMHHIEDVGPLFKKFRAALRSGGALCIADLETEDGHFHDDPTGIQHHGFAVAEMEQLFRDAGFGNIRTVRVCSVTKQREGIQQDYPVNLTIGAAED